MAPKDWTQPPLVEAPGDLAPALAGARLVGLENDRARRTVTLRFALPPDAGTPEAVFRLEEATHLLGFAYLPPADPLPEDLSPEETVARMGDWARQGLVTTFDPTTATTPLVVARDFVHIAEETATLSVEGYGEDPDVLVWWEVRVAGASFDPAPERV